LWFGDGFRSVADYDLIAGVDNGILRLRRRVEDDLQRFGVLGERCFCLVVHVGYLEPGVAGTVLLLLEGEHVTLVDPGMVSAREAILGPMASIGIAPEKVTDVVLSHHHLDHTFHVGLFEHADVHDYHAIYRGDDWTSRPAEGYQISPNVRLLETPGHTREDVCVAISTGDGLCVYTHLWWNEDGPVEDLYAPSAEQLASSRRRILDLKPDWIIPSHGRPFRLGVNMPVV
jgi:glyoxylase-like metal-dependent hydrolase (beta-lactamase superfamily II)